MLGYFPMKNLNGIDVKRECTTISRFYFDTSIIILAGLCNLQVLFGFGIR